MQNAVQGPHIEVSKTFHRLRPERRPTKASDSNRTVKSERLMFHKETRGQIEPRERLIKWKREIQQEGISDENDNEIQALHSNVTIDPLRRPRGNFSGGMCRESVCVQHRLLSDRIHGYWYYNPYPYSYYSPAYDTTVVRSGVRYNDAYGPRYYQTRTVYGDW